MLLCWSWKCCCRLLFHGMFCSSCTLPHIYLVNLGSTFSLRQIRCHCIVPVRFCPGILIACHPPPSLWQIGLKYNLENKLHSPVTGICVFLTDWSQVREMTGPQFTLGSLTPHHCHSKNSALPRV